MPSSPFSFSFGTSPFRDHVRRLRSPNPLLAPSGGHHRVDEAHFEVDVEHAVEFWFGFVGQAVEKPARNTSAFSLDDSPSAARVLRWKKVSRILRTKIEEVTEGTGLREGAQAPGKRPPIVEGTPA